MKMTEYQKSLAKDLDLIKAKWVHCEICNCPTQYISAKRCNPCWYVESGLANYLRAEEGRTRILTALNESILNRKE